MGLGAGAAARTSEWVAGPKNTDTTGNMKMGDRNKG